MSTLTLNKNTASTETKTASVEVPTTQPTSPFDPASLRLSQNFADATGVKKLVTTIPVRKPGKHDFIRVNPDPAFRLETYVLEFKEDNETYLVAPHLWAELVGELTPKVLFTTMSRQKVLFVWAIRLPNEDGKIDDWNASALEAAKIAQKTWVRVSSNKGLGAYDVFEAAAVVFEPDWGDMDFQKILEIAFKGRFIDNLDHPALRRLRGEV